MYRIQYIGSSPEVVVVYQASGGQTRGPEERAEERANISEGPHTK